MIENIAIVLHHIDGAWNDVVEIIVFREEHFNTYPNCISKTYATFSHFHFAVCSVDSNEHILMIFWSNLKDLWEEKVEEEFVLIVLEAQEVEVFRFELKTE